MSSNVSFLFSGQGSQKSGIIQEIAGDNKAAQDEIMSYAEQALGKSVAYACLSHNAMTATNDVAQCATLFADLLHYRLVLEAGIVPYQVSGLSIGEWPALVAAGALSAVKAFELVFRRGLITEITSTRRNGAMAAIIGLNCDQVESICVLAKETSDKGKVLVLANYNTAHEIVISGDKLLVEQAAAMAKEAGARRVVPLPINGGFHSSLMDDAALLMTESLQGVKFQPLTTPFYSSTWGRRVDDPSMIRAMLCAQLNSSTYMSKTIQAMRRDGATDFCEIGPGTSLVGFARRSFNICETCGIREGEPRVDNNLPYGTHCDKCAEALVTTARERSW